MRKAVIFDLDGTIWDAVDDLVNSWNDILRRVNISGSVVTRERLIDLMGSTMDQFARALIPEYDPLKALEICHLVEQDENNYLRSHGAELFGDVEETFRRLKNHGFFIGIVSNSQSGYIEAFLEYYHLEDLVDDIECYGDTLEGKAENLNHLIKKNHLDKFWYLGDTNGDYEACRKAEVPFIWATYGFGNVDDDVPHIDSLEEIVETVIELDLNE